MFDYVDSIEKESHSLLGSSGIEEEREGQQ